MKSSVATLRIGNKEIWDYRNLPIKMRLKIAFNLIFYGIVDIKWRNVNFWNIEDRRILND